ncbi:hypothetical protein BDV95DRAFT_273267 [Massariosphaeria phaeospora]|uniref:Uncharacterized protein n=1 Tax=Massariosphaeria phaeospora TaxID=100035 RepID=A0A7C8MRN5_9PLEO|nr:hypothetical protein BDV95DRAFT_273267 [Massariosphaeria phaeospora]
MPDAPQRALFPRPRPGHDDAPHAASPRPIRGTTRARLGIALDLAASWLPCHHARHALTAPQSDPTAIFLVSDARKGRNTTRSSPPCVPNSPGTVGPSSTPQPCGRRGPLA